MTTLTRNSISTSEQNLFDKGYMGLTGSKAVQAWRGTFNSATPEERLVFAIQYVKERRNAWLHIGNVAINYGNDFLFDADKPIYRRNMDKINTPPSDWVNPNLVVETLELCLNSILRRQESQNQSR